MTTKTLLVILAVALAVFSATLGYQVGAVVGGRKWVEMDARMDRSSALATIRMVNGALDGDEKAMRSALLTDLHIGLNTLQGLAGRVDGWTCTDEDRALLAEAGRHLERYGGGKPHPDTTVAQGLRTCAIGSTP